MYFIDTSALVKAYIPEKGSATVLHAFDLLGTQLYVSPLVAAEALGAFARQARKKEISTRTYTRARDDLMSHLQDSFFVVDVQPTVYEYGYGLIDRYRNRGAGPFDLMHVVTAEYLQSLFPERTVGFMCSDATLKDVALARGFDVFDPETDPVTDLLPPFSN